MPRGGHFAAHEEPELLADDVLAFLRRALAEKRERAARDQIGLLVDEEMPGVGDQLDLHLGGVRLEAASTSSVGD